MRERAEDIETLAGYFYGRTCSAFGRPALPLGAAAIAVLKRHTWPGNIRELKNLMQRVVALSPLGQELKAPLIEAELGPAAGPADPAVPTLRQAEERLVRQALLATGGNKTAAARLMGISKPTFFRMLREFGVNK